MADEGNLGLARALETDEDITKADLQRRMDEARESITETVTEIKETVVNQYNSVKESVSDALDWREQFRKHPAAWSVGALGVGIVVGYNLGGVVVRDHEQSDYPSQDHVSTADVGAFDLTDEASASRPSYSSGYQQIVSEEEKPGLIDRFKETRAYDRLQEEVADLGNRFMDELSNAARTVVLPALFNKVKEMIGVDLSNKRQIGGTSTHVPARDSESKTQQHNPSNVDRVPASSVPGVSARNESGKPAYPTASPNKFDRLGSNTPTPGGQIDTGPNVNPNYDDRYERESKLFSRGDTRGFAGTKPGETQTPATADTEKADRDDAPRGRDYTYEAGHTSGNIKAD